MGYWMGWGGWMPFHGILAVLLLVLVIVGAVTFLRTLVNGGWQEGHSRDRSSGLAILQERYAKGEIQRDEYLQKKRDLDTR